MMKKKNFKFLKDKVKLKITKKLQAKISMVQFNL